MRLNHAQLLHTGAASRPDATAPAAPSEGQRILAAQKEVFDEASKLHDAMDMRAAKKLYTLEEMIGEGGFGKVYEAKCRDKKLLPVQVAIKVMVHKPDDVKARYASGSSSLFSCFDPSQAHESARAPLFDATQGEYVMFGAPPSRLT